MSGLEDLDFVSAAVICLGLTVTSAVVPWVNAEVIVLSLPLVTDSPLELAALVLVATVGQMVGKCGVYWAGRKSTSRPSPRVARAIARWQPRLASRPFAAFGLVFLSSAVGIPPFYVMTLVCGAIRLNFRLYLLFGSAGRLVRFSAIALATSIGAS